MMKKVLGLTLGTIAIAGFAAAAHAQQPPTGNAEAAKGKISMCQGCHGIESYKMAFPAVYHVPKIAGQSPAYIAKALEEYKTGQRASATMQAIAKQLSEQDMADLAAYYGAAK
jgi:cytochrome c553